mgnify:CR=1 FL=1
MDQRTDNRVQCAGDGEHDGDEVERERECYIELDGAHHALGERDEVRQLLESAIMHLDAAVTRFLNPQTYPVGLELGLARLRQELSAEERRSSGRALL